jgi:hypothetical protein
MRWGIGFAVLALLLPSALVLAEARGDDWTGKVTFVQRGQVFTYEWQGLGCGFPMRCALRADYVQLDGFADPAATALWDGVNYAPYGIDVMFHLKLTVHGEPHGLTWVVAQRMCSGLFSGHVLMDGLGQPLVLGLAESYKTGPGPDGAYECGPT